MSTIQTRFTSLAACVTLAALSPSAHAADLFVGPGQAYAEIHAAIAAAAPGDRIFVAPGTYASFDLSKPLEIRGAGPALVRVAGIGTGAHSSVSAIPAGSVATIAGLSFEHDDPGLSTGTALLDVLGNPGTVVLQNLDLNLAPLGPFRGPGILTTGTERLLLQHCRILGANGPLGGTVGWPAIEAANVSLELADCQLLGGNASEQSAGFGSPGAPAVRLVGGELRLARVIAAGGRGGYDNIVIVPYAGGPAVELTSSTLTLTGGPTNRLRGGNGGTNSVTTAFGGPALHLLGSSTAELAADALLQGGLGGWITTEADPLSIEAGSTLDMLPWNLPALVPLPEETGLGGTFTLEHSGEPGAIVLPLFSPALGPALVFSGIDGVVHIDVFTYYALPITVLDAQGLGSTAVSVPLQPGLAAAHAWFQTVEVAGAAARLSNAARIGIAP